MNQLISIRPANLDACQNNFCHACGTRVDSIANFCGQCGAGCRELVSFASPDSATTAREVVQSVATSRSGQDEQSIGGVLNNRWAVIGMIALGGPLGLPALWFSPKFSKATKVVITTIYVLLSAVVPLVIAWYWLDYAVRPVLDLLDSHGGI